MLPGSRDVLCISQCVFLCEYVSVLAKAAADAQADFVLKKVHMWNWSKSFRFLFFPPLALSFFFSKKQTFEKP